MADKAPITSPLGDAERDITGRTLQSTLVDLVDLHLVAKQAHWNVVGSNFREVHLHLDELVDNARIFADSVAERAATIGVPPDARAGTVRESSGLPDIDQGWRRDRDVIEYVVQALGTLIRRLRTRIDEAGKTDPVTQDLLVSISSKLEETHWMWQAKLAGTGQG